MNETARIVAYSDLLAFSELVIEKLDAAKTLLSDFYNFAQEIKLQNPGKGCFDM